MSSSIHLIIDCVKNILIVNIISLFTLKFNKEQNSRIPKILNLKTQIFKTLIIHKPSLAWRMVPQKILPQSIQHFWRLLDTNGQADRQAKCIMYIYIVSFIHLLSFPITLMQIEWMKWSYKIQFLGCTHTNNCKPPRILQRSVLTDISYVNKSYYNYKLILYFLWFFCSCFCVRSLVSLI